MKTFKNYLKEILLIANYNGDIETLTNKAEKNIYYEAFLNLSNRLNGVNKSKLMSIIESDINNIQMVSKTLKENFTQKEIISEIENASKNFLDGLLQEIGNDFDDDQKQKLILLSFSIKKEFREL